MELGKAKETFFLNIIKQHFFAMVERLTNPSQVTDNTQIYLALSPNQWWRKYLISVLK